MKINTLLITILLILINGCSRIEQNLTPTQTHLGAPLSAATSTPFIIPGVEFKATEFVLKPDQKPENITTNPIGTYQAYTVEVPISSQSSQSNVGETQEIIVVENLKSGQAYQLLFPIAWRPISNIVWISPAVMAFDQLTQPHYGIHYIVDVETKKLISVDPFSDENNQRVIVTVRDFEGNPKVNIPVSVFENDFNTGNKNSTDSCGRTTFFLQDGLYRFGATYNNNIYLSSEQSQCQVLGCTRSSIILPIDGTSIPDETNSLCSGALCQSHILLEGRSEKTNHYQVGVFTIKDGVFTVILDNLSPSVFNIAFLKNGNQFVVTGANSWLSDLGGSPLVKVENPVLLLSNFQPFSPTWNLIAKNVGNPSAEDAQHGYWHSPDDKYIAKWRSGDAWLMFHDNKTGKEIQIYQTEANGIIKGNWSPDSQSFAFSYTSSGEDWYSQIFVVNMNGTGLHSLTPQMKYVSLGFPYWSPNGQSIVYTKTGPCSDYYYLNFTTLSTANTKSFSINKVLPSYVRSEEIVWSPDSKFVAYLTEYLYEDNVRSVIQVLSSQIGKTMSFPQDKDFIPLMIDWR